MKRNKIYWFSGPSGAGKTTVARRIQQIDRRGEGKGYIILDGDEMRESISLGAGFSREERMQHNLRVARLAKILSSQVPVIVTVIAPMKEVREFIDGICSPTWVYIKRTMPEREGHFYEEPVGYFTSDHDKLDVMESATRIMVNLMDEEDPQDYINRMRNEWNSPEEDNEEA